MATALAHEINTPIGTIRNILLKLKVQLNNPDTSVEVLNAALDRALMQTQYSRNIIDRISEFTQARRHRLELLDVSHQLQDAIGLLEWLLSSSSCEVKLEMPDSGLRISGNATMLQQVIVNLIRNAIDAMRSQNVEQRVVTVTAEQVDGKVIICVADTGCGLADKVDKQLVPYDNSESGGMGIGLNICRSFIELHRGRLWLSLDKIAGSACYVELPLASPAELQTYCSK